MQSPRIEWVFALTNLAALDHLRAHGEADGDTLSEVIDEAIKATRHGDLIFTVALFADAEAFRRHILCPVPQGSSQPIR